MKYQKPYVIAELGINHNGNLKLGKKLIYSAFKSGANAVKFQTYVPELRFGKTHKFYKIFKKFYLNFEDELKLWRYAKDLGLEIFTSPFDNISVENCRKNLKLLAGVKIASFETTNLELVRNIASLKIKTLFSTGQNNFSEVKKTINTIKRYHNKIIPMHCISSYPTSDEDSNLIIINYLQKNLKYDIGFSDHSIGHQIAIYASCMGVKYIEKHFTTDNKLEGPDHKFSMNPKSMSRLIEDLNKLNLIMGNSWMGVRKCETSIFKNVRRVSK